MILCHRLFAAALLMATGAPAFAEDAPPETRLCLENRAIRAKDMSAANGYFVRTSQGWWRNTGPGCSAYARDRALRTHSTVDRQCRGDIVQVFEPFSRMEFGGCVLGAWERVSAPPKD